MANSGWKNDMRRCLEKKKKTKLMALVGGLDGIYTNALHLVNVDDDSHDVRARLCQDGSHWAFDTALGIKKSILGLHA